VSGWTGVWTELEHIIDFILELGASLVHLATANSNKSRPEISCRIRAVAASILSSRMIIQIYKRFTPTMQVSGNNFFATINTKEINQQLDLSPLDLNQDD
jgi:hypothetical protein